MIHRSRLIILGNVVAVALAISGILAAGAAATTQWTIQEKSLSELGLENESLSSSKGALTVEMPTFGFKVACTSETGSGLIIGSSKGEATLKLSSCTTFDSKGNPLKACPVTTPLTLTAETEFIEHEKKSIYDIFKGKAGKPLATIVFASKECALGEKVELTGTAAAEMGLGEWPERTLTFSKTIAEGAKAELKFGSQKAFLSGSVIVKLSGGHSGQEWGVLRRETLLCEVESNPCPSVTTYPASTAIAGESSEARFEGSFGTVKCAESAFEGKSSEEKAEPLAGTISALSFSSCLLGETACTLTTEHLSYNTSLKATGPWDGTLSVTAKEAPAISVTCGKLSCTLSGSLEFAFTGGATATISANKASFASPKEGTCAKTALTVTYNLQQPEKGAVFVAREQPRTPTKLCAESYVFNAETANLKCTGSSYLGEAVLGELQAGTAEIWQTVEMTRKSAFCNESSFEGRFAEDGSPGAVLGGFNVLTFTNETGGIPGKACPSSNLRADNPTVTFSFPSLPNESASLQYLRPGNDQGVFFAPQNGPNDFKVELQLGEEVAPETCNYRSPIGFVASWLNGVGGNPSTLRLFTTLNAEAGNDPNCLTAPALEENLVVTGAGGTNLYLTGE